MGESARGRETPQPLTHTFPNGAVATVYPLSQFTIANLGVAAQKRLPKPQPPLAPGVGGELEPNEADPTYLDETLPQWQAAQALLMNDLLIEAAVEVDIDTRALERVRRVLERIDAPLDEVSDTVAYIKHVCYAGVDETRLRDALLPLLSLITGKALPTEADVQAHVETFPADVAGA